MPLRNRRHWNPEVPIRRGMPIAIPCAPSTTPVMRDGKPVECDSCGAVIMGRVRTARDEFTGVTAEQCWSCWSGHRCGLGVPQRH